jgi:hypothetical protein
MDPARRICSRTFQMAHPVTMSIGGFERRVMVGGLFGT